MSPLNKDGVRLRKTRVRDRLQQLRERESAVSQDRGYYRSAYFRAQLADHPDTVRWTRARTPEDYTARLAEVLRTELVDELVAQARTLPVHLGSRSLRPHPSRVAVIADPFLWSTFEGTAELTYLTPENFRDVAPHVDLLLIASTWRGRFEEWHGTISESGIVRTEVIPHFRSLGVPVAFYSKEDPPNYTLFRSLGRESDYVFTSAAEKIPDYRADCPDARDVRSLTFGVNPLVHNPVGSRRVRRPEVLFAGSWLDHKYPARKTAAMRLFDGVLDAGRDLLILDRNSRLGDPRYFFPEGYLSCIGPGVDHADLMRIQRMTDVHLNLNSVVYSPTMFANRAVELQAMGGFVLSNYNMAVNDLFPEVQLVDDAAEVPPILGSMQGEELYRSQMSGLRRVFTDHLAHDRMGEILRTVGLPTAPTRPRVAVTAEEITPAVHELAQRQSLGGIQVLRKQDLRRRQAQFDVVVPVDSRYEYAGHYVQDLVNGFAYADVDFVAKNGYEQPGRVVSVEDHEPVGLAHDRHRSALWADGPALEQYVVGAEITGSGYSVDPFGVNTAPATGVTVAAAAPELTVVVPVYNNGQHLEHKCFRSLQRSTVFDRMEILLIDDGSTDGATARVVEELAARHPNVRARFNETGGSGSASRPRNQGLAMATAPYLTYLDPDNEAVNDGFRVLLEQARDLRLQFAIGDMLKLSTWRRYVHNAQVLDPVLEEDPVGGKLVPEDVLERTGFQPMSIQALVADTAWLRAIGLHQPVGALGQDSMAFQQMLTRARRIDTVRMPIHIYYGAVANSMVNTVGPGFFRKYLPLERARSAWLRQDGLYEAYCRTRADAYFQGWFVNKFNKQVAAQDREECKALLLELATFYDIRVEQQDSADPDSPLEVIDRVAGADGQASTEVLAGEARP
ncbi:glycosyltransferase [Kocuria sp. M1R5S2]|uniref:glycosyltransferase n=1 Tax=Kocuria rhizosphaerae TaxID=3376285 RepID=UPI003793201C